jgi:protein SCO1/2
MSQRTLLILILALAAALVGLTFFWRPQMVAAPGNPAAPAGGDFVLSSADGPFDTASQRGKVLLIYFGYTYCPDICPTSLTATSQALNQLSADEQKMVKTVFVSVDPERDTPARLKDYVAFFHPNIVGVTGTPDAVASAARRYGAIYARQDVGGAGYVVDHSAWTYVVAPDGRLLGQIPHGASVEQIVAAIRKALPPLISPKGNS